MLYLAISSCARADSASASSANSVDSALASSARILPSIRSSAGSAFAARRGCAAWRRPAGRCPAAGAAVSRTGRCWNTCSVSIAVATAPTQSGIARQSPARRPGTRRRSPTRPRFPLRRPAAARQRGHLGGPAGVHGGGGVAAHLVGDHVRDHRRVRGATAPGRRAWPARPAASRAARQPSPTRAGTRRGSG